MTEDNNLLNSIHKGILSIFCTNLLNCETNEFNNIQDKGLFMLKNSIEISKIDYVLDGSFIEIIRLIIQSKKFSFLVIIYILNT